MRGEIEIDLEGDWGELDSLYKCFHTPTIHQINRLVNNYFYQLAKYGGCGILGHDKMNITFWTKVTFGRCGAYSPGWDRLCMPGSFARPGRSGDKTGILCSSLFEEILRKRDLEKIIFPFSFFLLFHYAAVAMILESEKDLYCDHSGEWRKTVEYKFQYKKYKQKI